MFKYSARTMAQGWILLTLCVVSLTGCQPMIKATPDDLAMIARFIEMDEKMEYLRARDIFNHMRGPSNQALRETRDQILADQAVPAADLANLRAYLQRRLELAELAANWPEPEVYQTVYTSEPVQVDAKIQPVWEQASAVPIHFRGNNPEPLPGDHAVGRMVWDQRYLYVLFEVPDHQVHAPRLERDGPVWRYDCVEIFLMANLELGLYWELNVSPTGSIYDALCFWRTHNWASEMRPDADIRGLQTASRIVLPGEQPDGQADSPFLSRRPGFAGYVTEIAIPWDQIPDRCSPPQAGDVFWGLMAMASWSQQAGEDRVLVYKSHSPTIGGFHNIHTFAPIELTREW